MKQAYSPEKDWNQYASSHASVTSFVQLKLFREIAEYLHGDVLDCGCGTAKVAPVLALKKDVESYTGVDFSEDMVDVANWVLEKLNRPEFTVKKAAIELFDERSGFDSVLSVHSYYTWPDPIKVLQAIYNLVRPGGIFILATPNPHLDMKALLKEATAELITHPDFEQFSELNNQFADNEGAHFVTMDRLIGQVRSVGFSIDTCHSNHYMGGVNFICMHRPVHS